jgi:hypothetical protein
VAALKAYVPPAKKAPTNKEECKHGGWKAGDYRNQGQCVSAFASAGKKGGR